MSGHVAPEFGSQPNGSVQIGSQVPDEQVPQPPHAPAQQNLSCEQMPEEQSASTEHVWPLAISAALQMPMSATGAPRHTFGDMQLGLLVPDASHTSAHCTGATVLTTQPPNFKQLLSGHASAGLTTASERVPAQNSTSVACAQRPPLQFWALVSVSNFSQLFPFQPAILLAQAIVTVGHIDALQDPPEHATHVPVLQLPQPETQSVAQHVLSRHLPLRHSSSIEQDSPSAFKQTPPVPHCPAPLLHGSPPSRHKSLSVAVEPSKPGAHTAKRRQST